MWPFCKHDWQEKHITHAPGIVVQNLECTGRTLERLVLGVTTIIWECSKCKKLRKEEMLGEKK